MRECVWEDERVLLIEDKTENKIYLMDKKEHYFMFYGTILKQDSNLLWRDGVINLYHQQSNYKYWIE